ncbi:MAG: hypothetical protein ISR50_03720 [Alphaproteobacteria bacterium]|nr:hypothetical protein [Alphaproteobacteria bacterium]
MDPFAELGKRIELVSTDKYFRDVSIGLYAREESGNWAFRVRSFAKYEGLQARIDFILNGMQTLGGMQRTEGQDSVRFPCGNQHLIAVRRLFLQACKEKPEAAPDTPVLSMWDKKSELTVKAVNLGQGTYALSTVDAGEDEPNLRRLGALRNAMVKLADAQADEVAGERFCFTCGQDHDPLVGLLLQAAPNVRAVMREFEMNAARGVLLAPGSQE